MTEKTLNAEQCKEVKKLGLEAMSLLTHVYSELNIHQRLLMKADICIGHYALQMCQSQISSLVMTCRNTLKILATKIKLVRLLLPPETLLEGHKMLAMVRVFTSALGSGRQKTSRARVQQSTAKTGKAEANPASSDSSFFINPDFSG